MQKIAAYINRFTFGEVSPLLCARGDLVKYNAGCKSLVNFIPLLQGPVQRRGGTRFIAKAGNNNQPVVLIDFAFSETISYVLEFGHLYMRIYSQGRPVMNGEVPYQISTPWSQGDLFLSSGIAALRSVQSADVMYIVCPGQPPQKLARHGHIDWRVSALPNWRRDDDGKREEDRPNATAIALFRERLCLAAAQTIFMSQSGAFENFKLTEAQKDPSGNVTVPIAADDPIEINVYSEQMDRIEWLSPSDELLVGTTGGEFRIGQSTSVDPLGPENIKVTPETAFGSSSIQALRIGSVVLFVQRAGRKVREFLYDYTGENYVATDVTVAAEHITRPAVVIDVNDTEGTRGGLTAIAWQSEPIETLWAIRSDGQLLGFTYSKDQDMTAWHRHQLGGGAEVSQMAVIPAKHGGRDELWLSVKRTVAGEEVYYIERMEEGYVSGDPQYSAFFVDSGLTVVGEQMTEINGLEHLEGHEVAILGDGGVQPRRTVKAGRIVLQTPADVAQIGLPYDSMLTTLNLEAQLQDGTAQGRTKRIIKVVLRMVESLGGAAGPNLGNLQILEFREGSDKQDVAPPLFSGDKGIDWSGGYETDGVLTVVQNFPLPFTLAAIIPQVNVGSMHS